MFLLISFQVCLSLLVLVYVSSVHCQVLFIHVYSACAVLFPVSQFLGFNYNQLLIDGFHFNGKSKCNAYITLLPCICIYSIIPMKSAVKEI